MEKSSEAFKMSIPNLQLPNEFEFDVNLVPELPSNLHQIQTYSVAINLVLLV